MVLENKSYFNAPKVHFRILLLFFSLLRFWFWKINLTIMFLKFICVALFNLFKEFVFSVSIVPIVLSLLIEKGIAVVSIS